MTPHILPHTILNPNLALKSIIRDWEEQEHKRYMAMAPAAQSTSDLEAAIALKQGELQRRKKAKAAASSYSAAAAETGAEAMMGGGDDDGAAASSGKRKAALADKRKGKATKK